MGVILENKIFQSFKLSKIANNEKVNQKKIKLLLTFKIDFESLSWALFDDMYEKVSESRIKSFFCQIHWIVEKLNY